MSRREKGEHGQKGEPLNALLARFSKTKVEKRKAPELKARLAAAYGEAREKTHAR
jgi:hypothetical protein